MPLDPQSAVPGTLVSTLAARARIRELEESPAWLSAHGSRQQRSRGSDPSREIIELAVRYSLISRETSFVAVERREPAGSWRRAAAPHSNRAHERMGRLRAAEPQAMAAMAATALPAPAASYGELSDAMALRSMPSPTATVHGMLSRMADLLPGRHTPDSDDRPGGLSVPDPGDLNRAKARTHRGRRRSREDAGRRVTPARGWSMGSDGRFRTGDRSAARQAASGAGGRLGDADEVSRAWATALALQWLKANAAA